MKIFEKIYADLTQNGLTNWFIILILLFFFFFVASGVFSSKEKAQNQVCTGVSTNVGATVFNLTIMWGICVIFGAKEKNENSTLQHEESSLLNFLQVLTSKFFTLSSVWLSFSKVKNIFFF